MLSKQKTHELKYLQVLVSWTILKVIRKSVAKLSIYKSFFNKHSLLTILLIFFILRTTT